MLNKNLKKYGIAKQSDMGMWNEEQKDAQRIYILVCVQE